MIFLVLNEYYQVQNPIQHNFFSVEELIAAEKIVEALPKNIQRLPHPHLSSQITDLKVAHKYAEYLAKQNLNTRYHVFQMVDSVISDLPVIWESHQKDK